LYLVVVGAVFVITRLLNVYEPVPASDIYCDASGASK